MTIYTDDTREKPKHCLPRVSSHQNIMYLGPSAVSPPRVRTPERTMTPSNHRNK